MFAISAAGIHLHIPQGVGWTRDDRGALHCGGLPSRGRASRSHRNNRIPIMRQLPNEDLFESTKMSFGEHLEELRVCLIRAFMGLAVGFLLGLLVADQVVRRIEGPLKDALETYYHEKTETELRAKYPDVNVNVLAFMQQQGFVFEEVYWEIDELARVASLAGLSRIEQSSGAASGATAGAASGVKPFDVDEPGPPTAEMVKTRLWRPMDANVTSLSVHEAFMIWVKAALITGAIISSPWIFWQFWSFVAAGLYPHEKGYVHFFLPVSLGLFFGGAALAFFFVFQPVLDFLFGFNRMMSIDPDPRISEWMSFVLMMPLGFGISFQLPLVMLVLDRIGIVSAEAFIEKWRIAILVIFVISMVLTPADPVSMLLMACPLTVLYFGGILMCKYLPKRQSPFGQGYDPQ
jgi:sec-independent protein translocase protein TatC